MTNVRTPIRWVALVGSVLVAAACSSTTEGSPGANVPEGISDFQKELLADGIVTDAEYRRAVEAARECVEKDGWETSEVRAGRHDYDLGFGVRFTGDHDPTAADASMDRCHEEYQATVYWVYAQSKVVPLEEREALAEELRQCLLAVGVEDVPYDPIDPREEPIVQSIVNTFHIDDPRFGESLDCLGRYEPLFPRRFEGASP